MMKCITAWMAAVLATASVAGVGAQESEAPAAPSDAATELEGTWHLVAAYSGIPGFTSVARYDVTYHGKTATMTNLKAPGKPLGYTIDVDPKASPKTIDMLMEIGGRKSTSLGIYEVEGDTLKICSGSPGDPRPKDFQIEPGLKRMLVVLQRGPTPTAGPRGKEGLLQQERDLAFKQMGLGMWNYHDVFKRFPPQAIRGKDGRALLSWRVAVLPYMEQGALYDKFRLDEPWDSPHNKQFLKEMPKEFETPGVDKPGMTSIVVFTGDGTPFGGKEGPKTTDFTDGKEWTLMIVQGGADKAVPWTKPEDIPFDKENPVAALGAVSDPIWVGLADGSVLKLKKNIDAETFGRLVQHQDGPPASLGKFTASESPDGEAAEGGDEWKLRVGTEYRPPAQRPIPQTPTSPAEPEVKTPSRQPVERVVEYRTWTSADGRFTIEASLVKAIAGVVHLKRKDNDQTIQVPMEKLSEEDQKFLRRR